MRISLIGVAFAARLVEYGAGSFEEDYGREIQRRIGRNYERKPFRANAGARSSLFEYYVRRVSIR